MSYHGHHRNHIVSPHQHPFSHPTYDILYTNSNMPGITNIGTAMDWLMAVIYPNAKDAVADVASLPAGGNTINDYRLVTDDGDGKAAAYRWQQREGDVAAKWYKVYDLDWGEATVVSRVLSATQDVYMYKYGLDDLDSDGSTTAGVYAGQIIYGGASAATNLTLRANSGDGVGADTGYVQVDDNFRPAVDSTLSLGTTTERWGTAFVDTITSGTMVMTGGSLTDTSGDISFGDENLLTTGTLGAGVVTGSTGSSFGNVTIADGSITDSSGALSFGDEDVSTTGNLGGAIITASTNFVVGTLTVADGSITDSDGAITFGDETLTTTGILNAGQANVDSIRADGTTMSITAADTNLNINANGTGIINLGANLTGLESTFNLVNADNLRLDANTLSSTNADGNIIIDPNGAGLIEIGAATYPATTSAWDFGKTGNVWNDIWLDGNLKDGTNTISMATIMSLRSINSGVADNEVLSYDNGSSTWISETIYNLIDHGSITSGLGDDDHAQYLLLLGRSGGQDIIGGIDSGDDLSLESTSHGTKGHIYTKSDFSPFTNASYSGGWSGTDIGDSSHYFKDVYTKGQFYGIRPENKTTGTLGAASAQNVGRLVWNTTTTTLYADTGGAWVSLSDTSQMAEVVTIPLVSVTAGLSYLDSTNFRVYVDDGAAVRTIPFFDNADGFTNGYIPYYKSADTEYTKSPLYTDGTNVGIGTASPGELLHIYHGAGFGSSPTADRDLLTIESNDHAMINIIVGEDKQGQIVFSDDSRGAGVIGYLHSTDTMTFDVAGAEAMSLDVNGNPIFNGSIKATTGDPTASEGMLTINTNDNVIKIYADGSWRTLVSW